MKPTVLHTIPQFQGMPAYEMKPRINSILFYIKVMLQEVGSSDERMLLLSVHPDH